jgi:hypothetical protein
MTSTLAGAAALPDGTPETPEALPS